MINTTLNPKIKPRYLPLLAWAIRHHSRERIRIRWQVDHNSRVINYRSEASHV